METQIRTGLTLPAVEQALFLFLVVKTIAFCMCIHKFNELSSSSSARGMARRVSRPTPRQGLLPQCSKHV